METLNFGKLASSVDPSKLSSTVIATAKTLAGLLVFAGIFTVDQSNTFLSQTNIILQSAVVLAPLVFSMWHASEIVFGLFQKAIVAVVKTRQ
jgi:hypothetical protein